MTPWLACLLLGRILFVVSYIAEEGRVLLLSRPHLKMLHSSVCCFWRTIAVIIVAIISQDEVVSAHKLSHLTSTFIPSSSTPSLLRHRHQGSCKNNSCSGSFSGRIKHVDTATHVLCSSSPISSSSQLTSPSPWSPGKWKLTLDFGVDEPKPDSSSLEQNENRIQLHKLLGDNWGAEEIGRAHV